MSRAVPAEPTGAPSGSGVADDLPERFLSDVEAHLTAVLARRRGPVARAATAAVSAGGKRLRPVLVLAGAPRSSTANPAVWSSLVHAAVAVELVHTASLVHDDLLDDAPLRRGVATAVRSHGERVAIAAGDLLFSVAFGTLLDCRELAGDAVTSTAVRTLAVASRVLAEGEALQARQQHDVDLDEDEYLDRCQRKTGVLFGASLALGAVLGQAPSADVERLERFGTDLGVAFQVADDVLDCAPSDAASTIGKQPGTDVRDGTLTLPLLLAARRDAEVARRLRSGTGDVDETLRLVAATGALDDAGDRARRLAARAVVRLADLDGEYHDDLLRSAAVRAVHRSA